MSGLLAAKNGQERWNGSVCIAWFLGIFAGVLPFFSTERPAVGIARFCLTHPPTLWGMMFAFALPVLLTAVFYYMAGRFGVVAFGFLQGFLYAFVSFAFLICLGSEGVLLCSLLLIFHQLCAPFFCFLWIYLLRCSKQAVFSVFLLTFVICVAAGLLNYALVMPLTASLIDI